MHLMQADRQIGAAAVTPIWAHELLPRTATAVSVLFWRRRHRLAPLAVPASAENVGVQRRPGAGTIKRLVDEYVHCDGTDGSWAPSTV
jgi:hypothetical protein